MSTAAPLIESRAPADFASRLHELAQPPAFPFELAADQPIDVVQTYASAVILAGDRAYKLKKPKNFGFFDYSTPALRRHFCAEEVRLNARLAPSVYLGVAPVLALPDGCGRFGATLPARHTPEPGAPVVGGTVVDYAVVMVRLSEEVTLESLVRIGAPRPVLIDVLTALARKLADFHAASVANRHVARFGARDVIGGNWEENFRQMRPYVGRALDSATYDHIMGYVHRFLAERGPLFASRVRAGRIRDCHGDLRLQHVYALGPRDHPGGQLAIIDCIEFNERFRYGDVAGEVAFLAMELDAAGRPELARTFVDEYVAETGDEALRELLPFYACYRACVRGKVASFQLDEPEVPPAQREAAQRQAASLFELADRYASGPTRPQLVLVGGLMGTGKTALAHALRRELGWALYASDTTRKRLAHLDPTVPQPAGVGEGIYSPEWTARTYQALLAEAGLTLAEGRSVLLDATFGNRRDRQAAAQIAAAYGARAVFIECACPRAVALARLARRWSMRTEESAIRAGKHPKDAGASDGRPELYDAQCAVWEPFDGAVEPGLEHTVRSTDLPLAIEVGSGREALRGLSDTGTLAPLMRHEPAQQADAIS